ncbi:DUF1552 domain-containing protein [Alienimonas californiensis]|uniref:DUF1552 domain-containing protein n=1 Tax=Alienimonas californiensis TaxID=2527989 RepID=A0A517PEG7_9PLAN|nr:DUF1552 domain-containing protein [Alienimonas californiensis]QDT17770.1 hypothetical protein CA12_39030 [Alienimonas californiensis]
MAAPLPRRTFLRGAGAALALPWLGAMNPALGGYREPTGGRLATPPLRSAFLFKPNGMRPDQWTPEGDGEQYELSPLLKPLAGVKGDFSVLENLWNEQAVGRNGHWPKIPAYLSGGYVVRTSGRDLDIGGQTADQLLAQELGDRTPLPSLELGVDEAYSGVDNIGGGFTRIYGSHIAWRDRHTPVPKEIVPRLAFDRLFRSGPKTPPVSGFTTRQQAVTDSLATDDTSVLDLVLDDAKDLRRKVGVEDRAKLDEYLASVRSVETRIENALKPQKRWINEGRFDVPRPGPGIPEDFTEHTRLMLDVLVLAFWTDTTRVATYMFGNAQTGRNFSFLDGVSGSYHSLSHHKNEPKGIATYVKINAWHSVQLAYLLEKMKGLKEADGTLLDHSQILFGCTIKDGNAHQEHDLPILLAGGGNGAYRPGRRVRFEKDTPLCNVLLRMLQTAGVERDAFGDSTAVAQNL